MNLLQMSFSGAVLILAVIAVRAAAINKLPKKTFLILWEIVLLRLIIPFSIPSALSVYSLASQNTAINALAEMPAGSVISAMQGESPGLSGEMPEFPAGRISIWLVIWLAGMALCAAFFAISYLRCRLEFSTSLPIYNDFVENWLKEHPLNRPVCVRQSDKISTPLTYGIFKPVILVPKKTDWEDTKQLQYIFLHEYVHIRRFDAAAKLVSASALCVHWFNPFVWAMYALFNRDIELACDESVVRQSGEASKKDYSLMLIGMEAKKSGLLPFCNNFSRNSIEERISAIMKTKKTTIGIFIISIIVIAAITAFFATSAKKQEPPMVFVMGRVYVSTQENVSEAVAREAAASEYDSPYIGIIETTVAKNQVPSEEMQSNFGYAGSEIIFNGSGIAVSMDGEWIQFEPQTPQGFPPTARAQALSELISSIAYSEPDGSEPGGRVSFTIPGGDSLWSIQISGRIEAEGFGGMSVHYLAEESESSSWESGKTYSFDVSEGAFTELAMYIEQELDGARDKASVDIMELLPRELHAPGAGN